MTKISTINPANEEAVPAHDFIRAAADSEKAAVGHAAFLAWQKRPLQFSGRPFLV
ncbi:MAG: hypothetical protein ABI293_11870 [Rhodanobacter sp.]